MYRHEKLCICVLEKLIYDVLITGQLIITTRRNHRKIINIIILYPASKIITVYETPMRMILYHTVYRVHLEFSIRTVDSRS